MLPVADYKVKNNNNQTFNLKGKVKVRLVVIFTCLITTLFTAQLVFANSLATDGQKLAQIQNQIKTIEAENMNLKVKIASGSSLTNLSKKAEELGFRRPTKETSL